MKTQAFGVGIQERCDMCLRNLMERHRIICELHRTKRKNSGYWKHLESAYNNYRANRENGEAQDNPPGELKYDGKAEWELQADGFYHVKYTEGPGDQAWMEEKDLNYLTRLAREGKLEQIEPAWRDVLSAWVPESKKIAAIARVKTEIKVLYIESKINMIEPPYAESKVNLIEPQLKQDEINFEQLLNQQRFQQEAFQKTLMQQLQEQQKQITQQLQEQQNQFKEQQDQLKSQFETLTTELRLVQQSLKEELNAQQTQKFEHLNNKATELTTHFTHELDQLRFFKSDNTSIWRTVIANKDYDHLSLLLERKVSPKGMSFISVSDDKAFQAHRAILREKGAIFTPEELLQDLDEALSKDKKGMNDKKYLKNLREGVMELLDLTTKGALPKNIQKTYDKTTVQALLLDTEAFKIPEYLQKVLFEKIRLIQTQKSQAWLSKALAPEMTHQLDKLIARRFWEQLKTTEEKENPNYPFIRENIATCFVNRYRENDFPESFREEVTDALTTDFLERYKKREIEKPLSAAIAQVAKRFYDEDREKAVQMDLYYQKGISEVIQQWRSNQLTPEVISAVDQSVLKIEEKITFPKEVRQQLDEAGIARLLDQIKNDKIDDPLMKLSLDNQVQSIILCMKAKEEECEQALHLIVEDWHDQKLDASSTNYLIERATKLWQDRLESIKLALSPWLKTPQVETTTTIAQPKSV